MGSNENSSLRLSFLDRYLTVWIFAAMAVGIGVEWDFVATMGCGDDCPYIRAKHREDWHIADQKYMDTDEFGKVRDEIGLKVEALIMNRD